MNKKLETRAFALATGDEDARACQDISKDQCRDQPRNFGLTLLSLAATKTGDELASARLVLAWLLLSVGAPEYLLALLVPIREAGALLPQLLVAAWIRRLKLRKWVWVLGSLLQGLALLGMVGVSLTFSGHPAGLAIVGLLVLFALARGLCSVAYKDVLGKTVDRGKRGQLSGWASSAGGLGAIAAGIWLQVAQSSPAQQVPLLLMCAGVLWLLAATSYSRLQEYPGATSGGANAIAEAISSLSLLRTDKVFAQFCWTRTLLLSTALAFPFYAALASESGQDLATLGGMVAAGGLAGLLAGPAWGRWSDKSSRQVMMTTGLLAGLLGIATWLLYPFLAQGPMQGWLLSGLYFIIALAHQGVRVARSTYLVDIAPESKRASYTAVSNTLIGVLLLLTSSVGALTPWLGASGVIGLFGLMALGAALSAYRLPEVDKAREQASR